MESSNLQGQKTQLHMSHSTTKPTKGHVRPANSDKPGIHPVWSESSLGASSCGQGRLWSIWGFAGYKDHFVGVVVLCSVKMPSNENLYLWKLTSLVGSTKSHQQAETSGNSRKLEYAALLESVSTSMLYEPCHEKTCLRGFRPGKTQTCLLS